ncbi:MAG: indolepyruvate ferredoxin oxidoreductase subunit alpha [Kiritimatiellaeota bacterium]|nr:indolepyruvate ferredoxin oxidoreductase subunit alpha [Kiritimatiellota bacterium]
MKVLLSGNEAVAHGVSRAGCRVAAAYPGTPSTEIMENIGRHFKDKVDCEWSVNEKVAMEVAIGASIAGRRAFTSMKHVGLNVAMDPLMTHTYVGPLGGLVIVSADDPHMHSSQNEQDNRNLARFARAALLEPADSQEAYDMTVAAFDLSEKFNVPVIVRMTTRTSHASTLVDLGGDFGHGGRDPLPYVKDIARNIPVPAFARGMRVKAEARTQAWRGAACASAFNRAEPGSDKRFGFVTANVAYHYVKEVFPEFGVLKLGFTNPLPLELVKQFAAGVGELVVVEELDPIMEEQIRAAGIAVRDVKTELRMLELNPTRLAALKKELLEGACPRAPLDVPAREDARPPLPTRPPVLCAGCGHRGVFHMLSRLGATVTGDIGCYTLGAFPPLSAMDTTICMGACIGNAAGMRKAGHPGRIAAVLGDSTFFHSGLTGVLDVVYNGVNITTVVLDNRVTAMTGHQDNPGTGKTLMGADAPIADIAAICRALGVKRVYEVDAYDLRDLERVLTDALDAPEAAVVVAKRPCVLHAKLNVNAKPCSVDAETCKMCGACFKLGCPAIVRGDGDGKRFKAAIDPSLCTGCGLCGQVCKFNAIRNTGVPARG